MSSQHVHVDADAREAVRTVLDRTLLVEAGAGTGKTTALVDRLVSLVRSGVALRQIAAITFTEAAAAELRDRVRAALEQLGAEEALAQLDEAALSTLHGFAHRILAEHALDAGLPPEFEVLDEVAAGVVFEEEWRGFLRELLDDPDLETELRRGFLLGLQLRHLRDIAQRFHEHWDRLASFDIPRVEAPRLERTAILSPLRAALEVPCGEPDDRLQQHCDRLRTLAAMLEATPDDEEFLRVLGGAGKIAATRYTGRADAWNGRKDEVLALLGRAGDAADDVLGRARAAVLTALLPRIRDFVHAQADRRRAEGRLEFHDLLVRAGALVRADRAVRDRLRARWERILVDEFQDTDPLQLELVALLTSVDGDPGDRPWHELTIEPGRAFFVGDPKQSIYRFRRADIGLYLSTRAHHREGLVQLTQSFRAVPSIVAWVNEVFGALIVEDEAGTQPPYEALHAARAASDDDGSPAVLLLGGPDDSGARIREIRRREAAEIAALVRRTRRERWPVGEPARPPAYRDIAILLPTRAALGALERALESAGVPYRVDSRSLVWSTQEVRDLLSVLRALDDPNDQVAVVAALRSPGFGCRDDELAAYRAAGGRLDYRREPPESVAADHPVAAGMAWLHDVHGERWRMSVSALLERIVAERRLHEIALAHRRARDRQRRIRFLVDQARAFVEGGGSRVRDFVAWAERQAAEGAAVNEAVVPESDDDAVRILTIHGAKGLEFPIVVLAGLNARPYTRVPEVLWRADGGGEVSVGARGRNEIFATPGFEQLRDAERSMDVAESLRLLYVAATRARDRLVVSVHHKAGENCPARELQTLCEEAPHLAVRVQVNVDEPVDEQIAPPEAPPTGEVDLDAWQRTREALMAGSAYAPVVSATGLADQAVELVERERAQVGGRGRAGTAVGRAVHALVQLVDLRDPDGLDDLAAAQAAGEGIPERAREVAALARAALESEPVRAAASGRYWRELFVAAQIGAVTVEGFVDLLYETPDGLVVLDYKTDAVEEGELDAALARYVPQGAAYAAAVEEALGQPVARCLFLFLTPAGARVREISDLRAAVAEVRASLDVATPPLTLPVT